MEKHIEWIETNEIESVSYICGHCGNLIATNIGYESTRNDIIAICHSCNKPTYFEYSNYYPYTYLTGIFPGPKYGNEIEGIKESTIKELYNEARDCMQVGAYTAAVLCCRKLIMNFAVEKGEKEGKKFIEYIDYLDNNSYIPQGCKIFLDKIRTLGNEATHEIKSKNENDAKLSIDFIEMLFKLNYEFPYKLNNHNNNKNS